MDVGHRFCGYCGHPIDLGSRAGEDRAELRYLTVMFIDIVDSVAHTARLGAERFRELLRDHRDACARIIRVYGGFIAQYSGDGTMVYFGYPRTFEDNARRAVRAALDILRETATQPTDTGSSPISLRAAIHTGNVVVGDIRSAHTIEAMAAIGDAPNLAARLQAIARPGTLVVSGDTYRLVRREFACTPLGRQRLKGMHDTVVVFQVEAVTRLTFGDAGLLTPTIGRSAEASILSGALAEALAGDGQAVLLRGDAGIGKSRLVRELIAEADKADARCVVLKGTLLFQNTALYPVSEAISQLLGLDAEPDPAARFALLEQRFDDRGLDGALYARLLGPLLGLQPPADRPALPSSSPQQERLQIKRLIVEWLLHIARAAPVLMVVEDLHWADPSTVELLNELLPQIADARALVAMTAREEFDVARLGHARCRVIALQPLEAPAAATLARAVAGNVLMPQEVTDLIVARTDGVPFFIEEMTLAATDAFQDGTVDGTIDHGLIPLTLAEGLIARIDHIAAPRHILEQIAVIGRDFDLPLLVAVARQDAVVLQPVLDRLVNARLLEQPKGRGRAHYRFCHALIQDTIYQSTLVARRRQLHDEIASVLVRSFPEIAQQTPEVIAYHLIAAEYPGAALPYLRQAATIAMRRSAYVEAQRYIETAIDIVVAVSTLDRRAQIHAELLVALGVVLTGRLGHAAPEVGRAFSAARALCRGVDPAADLFPVLHGLYRFYWVRADGANAREVSAEMLAVAQMPGNVTLLVEAHRAAGNCAFSRGDHDAAETHFAEAVAHYDPTIHVGNRYAFGLDPLVGAKCVQAMNAWCAGSPKEARHVMSSALTHAQSIDHPFSTAWTLSFAGLLHVVEDDIDQLGMIALRQLACSEQYAFLFWRMHGLIYRGWWLHRTGGDRVAGLSMMIEGLAGYEKLGGIAITPTYMSMIARALFSDGETERAQHQINRAIAIARHHDEVWYLQHLLDIRERCIGRATCYNEPDWPSDSRNLRN
jgi:class 3 adenylate cyclase/tetratricopeptide (TPR) repeat protein